MNKLDLMSINAIRVLSAEGVQKANSGHPGLPMGAAPLAYTLWAKAMAHNPKNPNFFNRDRFVLSAGHGSMLEYSLLHLFGYGLTKEDLMNFRQLGSKTPGHPEYGHTVGVETTTGPLGQGVANGVGFALAENMLATKFNKEGYPIVDHFTFVVCGDGCMQEGIESEAASLAGTWGLGKLILLYDSNDITIEGNTSISFREDVAKRHEAQGWQVLTVTDGENIDAIEAAITLAKSEKTKPSLIVVRTTIGYGSPKAGTADCHGAPLGEACLTESKKNFGWTSKPFEIPSDVATNYAAISEGLAKYEQDWNKLVKNYKSAFPAEYEEFITWTKGKIPNLAEIEDLWKFSASADATRNSSGIVLNKLAKILPNLVGGSADLGPSNKSNMNGMGDYSKETPNGRNLHFGVREHAMAAISNGLALHGGLVNYCATFFVFCDYMKNAMRMSAIMNLPVTYILTHDSIGVGEDGPTHQPVEQLVALRSIPGLKVFRPADGKETTAAYVSALNGKGPTCIVATRQNLPQYPNSGVSALSGGYILSDCEGEPDVLLMASGSEVELIMKAQAELANLKIKARVVSLPCMELFDAQTAKYREGVLPSSCRARVAVEAASSYSWGKYVGLDGDYITMDTFGASAPAEKLFEIFGFTVDNIVATARKVVKNVKKLGLAFEQSENN